MKYIRRITFLSTLIALSLALSIIESFYFPSLIIPGIKLGLANIVILLVLYLFGFKEAMFVSLLRVFITSLLIGNIFQIGFCMSMVGAIFSLLVMFILKAIFKKISVVTVSIFGSLFHIIGQIVVAIIFLENFYIIYYFPLIAIIAIVTGLCIGVVVNKILKCNASIILSSSYKEDKKPSAQREGFLINETDKN